MKSNQCIVCKSENIKDKYFIDDRHYGNFDKKYNVSECLDCKLLFLNPMIEDSKLHNLYDEDSYYSYQPFEIEKKSNFIEKLKNILIGIKPNDYKFNPKNKRILDLGCGSGKELYQYKKKGAEVFGVEISKSGSNFGNKYDLNIYNGTLNEAKFPDDYFDYIRSNHSFEHIIEAEKIAKELYRITKKGGKLFIGVPNTKSVAYNIFGKYWYYLGVPFHPINYNPKNLQILMNNVGFETYKIQYNGDLHGILGSFQIYLNRNKNKKSHEGFFIQNKIFQILAHQIAKIFNILKIGDCMEIIFEKK